jgi:hypothetical protein
MAFLFNLNIDSNYIVLAEYLWLAIFMTLALAYSGQVVIRSKITRLHVQIGLTLVSCVMLYGHISNIGLNGIWLVAFVVTMILLPGVSALGLVGANLTGSRWEDVGLVYGLGFAFDCIAGTLVLGVPASQRGTWLLSSTLMLSFLSLFVEVIRRNRKNRVLPSRALSFGYDDLLLVGTLVALLLVYFGLYPHLSAIPGLDIEQNYLGASLVSSSSQSAGAITTVEPLLYVFQSLSFSVANPSEATFQMAYIILNLFIVLSFYVMAKVLLRGYSHQAPAVATVFWALFSGWGWIEYLAQGANAQTGTFLARIGSADAISYADLTIHRDFFFLSMEASLAIAFLVIYLTLKTDLGTKRIALMAPLTTLIPLLHAYAICFLFFFLGVWIFVALERQRDDLRQVGLSFLVGALPGVSLSYILGMHGIQSPFGLAEILASVGLAVFLMLSPSLGPSVELHFRTAWRKVKLGHAVLPLTIILMIVYVGFLLSWYAGAVPFDFQSLSIFGYVPWELYPVKLGIVGALGILGFFLAFNKKTGATRELTSLFILTVLMIAALRVTSDLQLSAATQIQLFGTGSIFNIAVQIILGIREERFFGIVMIPLSLIAAVAVTSLLSSKNRSRSSRPFSSKNRSRSSRPFVVLALVMALVVSGTSSTMLGFEYWQSVGNTAQPNPSQVEAIQNVQSQAISQEISLITSPTTSPALLELSDTAVIATESQAIWASNSPELPLSVLRYTTNTPTYIFLANGSDTAAISGGNPTYLDQLARLAGTTVQDQGAVVKLVQNMSAPSPASSTALVVPYDRTTGSVIPPVNSGLSGGNILGLYFTPNSSSNDYSKSPPTYSNVQLNEAAGFNGTESYISIPDNSNYPSLQVEFSFQPLDVSINQVIVSKLNYGGGNPQESWEVAQYGQSLIFKVSYDGSSEIIVKTGNILTLGGTYVVKCVYDRSTLTIGVNNHVVASMPYEKGIFNGTSAIVVGGELASGRPTSFARMLLNYLTVSEYVQASESALYASYDFLGSAELNFTSVLSQDSGLSKYHTLVLPYDDITDNATLESILGQGTGNQTIVILNDNGFGPILGDFGHPSARNIIAENVEVHSAKTTLGQPINMSIITPNDGVDVIASYSNGNLSVPFIMSRSYENHTLVYVNVFPLVLKGEIVGSEAERLAGAALEPFITYSDPSTVSPWFTLSSIIFNSMNSAGSISMKSNSVTPLGLNGTGGLVLESGGTKVKADSATSLIATGYNQVQMSATSASIDGGYGYYSFVTLSNTTMVFTGASSVEVTSGASQLSGQQVSVVAPGAITLLMREPTVTIDGITNFTGFYSLHPPLLYTDGRPVQIRGGITFQMYASDESSMALPFAISSSAVASYFPPLMSFNEWSAFLASTPYVAAIGCATIIAWFFFSHREDQYEPPSATDAS